MKRNIHTNSSKQQYRVAPEFHTVVSTNASAEQSTGQRQSPKTIASAMDFSFEKVFTPPALDLFGISQLNAASYELPAAAAEAATPTAGKQKKPRKRRSTGDKPYPTIKCPECPKTYRDNAAGQRHLQLHLTSHDPEAQAKFRCDKCAKTFPNEVYLKRHSNLCGAPRRRRSTSLGSSTTTTGDESSRDSAAAEKPDDGIGTIAEERSVGEVQLGFHAF